MQFIRRTVKIQCAFCGKGLGSCIGGDVGEIPSLIPALLPQAAYNGSPIFKASVDGHEYPMMCPECEAKQVEKKEEHKNETSNSDDGTERA